MFKAWRVGSALLAALVSFAGLATAKGPGTQASTSTQRIVTFDPGVPPAERVRIVRQLGGRVTHELKLINAVAADFSQATIAAADSGLQADPKVLKSEADFRQNWLRSTASPFADVELPSIPVLLEPYRSPRQPGSEIPSGPDPTQAPGQDSNIPWGVSRVNAPAAWATSTGAGVKVGIVDTGIDFNHPQLKANVKGGYNAVAGVTDTSKFMDDNGHGTHVSGTIAAVRNGKGVVGVAPDAELWGVKVLDANGSGTFADVIAGIDWAVAHKMDVVNMSLGGDQGSDALQASVQAAKKAGTTIIAAAGNSGPDANTVGYPAAYPEVIAIAAIDKNDAVADFSSRGPQVAFAAPGVDVYSTYMGGKYETMSGTSMACPHMVGLAALAISAKHIHGSDAIRAAFQNAATALVGAPATDQGAGVVDAAKLVR